MQCCPSLAYLPPFDIALRPYGRSGSVTESSVDHFRVATEDANAITDMYSRICPPSLFLLLCSQ
jgi:hypothetical protein